MKFKGAVKLLLFFVSILFLNSSYINHSQKESNSKDDTDLFKEKLTINVLQKAVNEWPEDEPILQFLKEKFNVEFNICGVTTENLNHVVRNKIASGNYLDWMRCRENSVYQEMYNNNLLWNISKRANELELNEINNLFMEEQCKVLQGEDGFYLLPHKSPGTNHGVYIRKDIFDQVELDIGEIVTYEDFEYALEKVKKADPERTIEEPLTLSGKWMLGHIITSFTGISEVGYYNGELKYWKSVDGYKDALIYLNKLYSKGLLDPDYSSNTNFTVADKITMGHSVAIIGVTSGELYNIYFGQLVKENSEVKVSLVTFFKGPFGDRKRDWAPYFHYSIITKAADKVKRDRILYVMDYLLSYEGKNLLLYGPENSDGNYSYTYHEIDGTYRKILNYNTLNEKLGGGEVPLRNLMTYDFSVWLDRDQYPLIWDTYLKSKKQSTYNPVHFMMDKRALSIQSELNSIWDKFETSCITGQTDIEEEWDDYINQLKVAGLDEYLDICDRWLDENPEAYIEYPGGVR